MTPPSADSTTASIRNCSSTSCSSAPMARRRPISRVRSVTLTSMMFMMPMPPTSRLTAATAPSSVVSTSVVLDSVSASCWVSKILKLSSSLSASWRRSRRSSRRLAFSGALSLPSCIDTSSVATLRLPVTRRCSVRSGTTTVSSWSPMPLWPLAARMPITVQENLRTRSCSPSPVWPAVPSKISRRTVSPMMHTAAPASCSSASKMRPLASFQLPVSNQALLLPMTLVAQLRPLATTVTLARPSGATAAMPPISAAMASASPSLNCGTPPPPPPLPPGPERWPGRTISRLVPRPEICALIDAVAPLPSVTMVITALTPMTMPRMVRKERSRLRRIERSASMNTLYSIRRPLSRESARVALRWSDWGSPRRRRWRHR